MKVKFIDPRLFVARRSDDSPFLSPPDETADGDGDGASGTGDISDSAGVTATAGAVFGRNYFNRPSAPKVESTEEASECALVLAEAAALKMSAVDYMYPEVGVTSAVGVCFGRNYFHRYSAPETEDDDLADERATILAEAAALKKLATDNMHPDVGVTATAPAVSGRNYFSTGGIGYTDGTGGTSDSVDTDGARGGARRGEPSTSQALKRILGASSTWPDESPTPKSMWRPTCSVKRATSPLDKIIAEIYASYDVARMTHPNPRDVTTSPTASDWNGRHVVAGGRGVANANGEAAEAADHGKDVPHKKKLGVFLTSRPVTQSFLGRHGASTVRAAESQELWCVEEGDWTILYLQSAASVDVVAV
jgi:hypothetical protein